MNASLPAQSTLHDRVCMDWSEGTNGKGVEFVAVYLTTRTDYDAGNGEGDDDLFQLELDEKRETTLGLVGRMCSAVNAADPATGWQALAVAAAFANHLVTDDHSCALRAAVESGRAKLALSEDEIRDFLTDRIESGDMDLGDITKMMARYGLMDPAAFQDEMQERIHNHRVQHSALEVIGA